MFNPTPHLPRIPSGSGTAERMAYEAGKGPTSDEESACFNCGTEIEGRELKPCDDGQQRCTECANYRDEWGTDRI